MNLSLKWLKEFVDIEKNPKEFAEKMTISGSKVETIEVEGEKIKNVVVGKVLSIEKHPDADKLLVCMVDVGQDMPIQIVTGAKNLTVGDIIPVALDGSVLADGTKIKKGKLRGVVSNGMLCSLGELGLSLNDFPYAESDGIFVLKEECTLGQDIKEAIGLNDTKVEFEITPNRPDCLSIIGLAREVAATFDKKLNLHTPAVKAEADCGDTELSVNVESREFCPYYSARVVKDVKIGQSPRWIRERLRTVGVRSINNIVDITNYVMMEYGQPMHAFDYSEIMGQEIIVRAAISGEKITTLDGIERCLDENTLVIADSEKPLAIAGVVGGEHSGITEKTDTIVLESANFNGSLIRTTSKKFALRTDSSSRFEKGLDANLCKIALDRACELIEMLEIGQVCKDAYISGDIKRENKKVPFDVEFINKFLNINLSREEMINILKKIDCQVEGDFVIAPSFRADLKNKFDIAEEIARFYGYNNIKSTILRGGHYGKYSDKQKFVQKVKNTLLAQGISEILTYSFISPKHYDKIMLGSNHKLRNSVVISNPLGEDTSVMRTTALPSILDVLSRNYNNKNENVKIFEFLREYIPIEGDSLPKENDKLVAGMYGSDVDFFTAKGFVEELFDVLKISNYKFEAKTDEPSYHSERCAKISCNGDEIGIIGEIHPVVAQNYDINERVYSFNLDIEKIFNLSIKEIKYKPLARFPAVNRDLALLCDENVPVADLVEVIKKACLNLLENIKIFDIYQGKQIPEGKKSVAFSIVLRSETSTLSEEEINTVVNSILKAFESQGIVLRA